MAVVPSRATLLGHEGYAQNREKMREYQRRWRAAHPGYQKERDKKQREVKLNATARAYRVIFRDRLAAQVHARYAAKKHVS